MPCFDAEEARERGQAAANFAKVEAMLCQAIKIVGLPVLIASWSESDSGISRKQLIEWWEKHDK